LGWRNLIRLGVRLGGREKEREKEGVDLGRLIMLEELVGLEVKDVEVKREDLKSSKDSVDRFIVLRWADHLMKDGARS
jgi:hypothetical protein